MTVSIEFYNSKARSSFGQLLRIVRKHLKLSQEEMAVKIPMSRVHYNKIEMGHHMPKDSDQFLRRVKELLEEQKK